MIAINEKIKLAKPFLKWAGGKTQLLNEIEKRLPDGFLTGQITTYVEPFVGGGAAFFYIAQNYPEIKKFCLYDVNSDLVNCYNAVKSDVRSLIKTLNKLELEFLPLKQNSRKEFYLKIRKKFNHEKINDSGVKIAAKLIFLNKTCFNGLYRVNGKDEFNVPFGGYKTPKICDEKNLLAASEVLQKAEIICGDFTKSRKCINKKTFVYLDPPYRPLSATASFTSYSKDSFTEQDQIRLADFCREIEKKGAKFLLSNSDPKNENKEDHFFENNFMEFSICRVKASRMINCKAYGRGQIDELLITN
ncbi:MAG: DNA adenine methylase [Phycisphaerae bacterium]|nr:DNA adenine methylase [Phycisphaerae bacterium]